MSTWKQDFANEAEQALTHPLVKEAIDELLGNLGAKLDGLEHYGITKVAQYAATVARAQAIGLDPDALRVSRDEGAEEIRRLAASAHKAGTPVIAIVRDDQSGGAS